MQIPCRAVPAQAGSTTGILMYNSGFDAIIPCPHFKLTITQRSRGQSAVAGAAYQSGESLFSEYDGKRKSYSEKRGIIYTEIMLPPNAPPEFADRNTLWNSVERKENQWNSQLARRIVMALPREVPPEQYPQMLRDYCQAQFVSKGMCVDFAIHNKGTGNPHAHVMLTMRPMDEHGRWLPKTKKVYDLDENGQRYKCPNSRYWASHKEDTVDWNDRKYGEIWRHAWEVVQNDYLERNGRPERVDLRSYARQGVDKIPTVHMGPAVFQMEKRGIRTNIGDLNRDIKSANSLMASIRAHIRHLKAWLDTLADALETRKEPTVPALLARYMEMREDERAGWSALGQLKGAAADLDKVMQAISYLKENRLISVDAFRAKLSATQSKADTIRKDMRANEKRMKVIAATLDAYETYIKLKPVYDAYSKKGFKRAKEKYAAEHKDELAAMKRAYGYLMHHDGVDDVPVQALQAEYDALREQNLDKETRLAAIQGDLRKLREIRTWVDKVIPSLLPNPAEQKQERSSVLAKLQEASPQPSVHSAKQKTQDIEH